MQKQTWGLRKHRPLEVTIPGYPPVTISRTDDDQIEVRVPDGMSVRRIDSEDDSLGEPGADLDCE